MTKAQIKLCERIYDKSDSTYSRLKMMAFLFNGKTLYSQGINAEKTDPFQSKFRKQVIQNEEYLDKRHAEADCLKGLADNKDVDPSKMTLFIMSKKKDGEFRSSKPCPVCRKIIESVGIGEICYVYNNRFVTEKLL